MTSRFDFLYTPRIYRCDQDALATYVYEPSVRGFRFHGIILGANIAFGPLAYMPDLRAVGLFLVDGRLRWITHGKNFVSKRFAIVDRPFPDESAACVERQLKNAKFIDIGGLAR